MTLILDANREPVFADLATDPRFAEIAAELLAPRSYGERHDRFAMPGVDCAACAPFKITFLAKSSGKSELSTLTDEEIVAREGVVLDDSPAARRARARQHGPQGNGKRGKNR